ncbi:MAG: YlmH/Sll1252 family protein [Acutalibacteraceae bacterium]
MISEDKLIQKRFSELAKKAYTGNHFTFTDFLGLSEIDLFYRCEREFNHVKYEMFGGTEGCSRLMVRFGDAEELGYSESYPIDCVKIAPLLMKFSDSLTHRDILGAVMGLGIKRSAVGDIILKDNVAYMFVVDRLSQYVCDNLFKVKHTSVSCEVTQDIPDFYESSLTEASLLVPSLRIDAVIAKLYNLSRNSSIELFREKKIFVNGRSCENNSYFLKENDIITVRGRGRFTFIKENFTTRKGNVNISVDKTQ